VRSFYPLWIALVLFLTHILFSTKEMEDWSVKDVLAFAREAGVSEKALKVLEEQEVTGEGLQDSSQIELERIGVTFGQAKVLIRARDKFLHRRFTAIIDHVLLFCSCHLVSFLF